MNLLTSRRAFLKASGGALAAWMSPAGSQAAEAGHRKRVGVIGCGWYGKSDAYRLLQVAPVEVVALCDVDRRMLEEAGGLLAARQASGRKPRLYKDFREMLREKDLDLVMIGTPDHWHALPALAAMEAGAHVYLQKPVGVDVMEGRAILEAARRLGKVVQIGTQRRSTAHLIQAKQEIIATGKLGTVGHIEMCSYYHMRVNRPAVREDPPEWLDWDFYCGPAPRVDYHPAMHPGGWRSFREFGNGMVGDMCIHMLDTARWLLDLGWPLRVSSSGGIRVQRDSVANVPDTQTAVFDFENVQAVWTHRTWGLAPDREFPWAVVLYGEKGTLKLSVQRYEFQPLDGGPVLRGEALLEPDAYPEEASEARLEKHAAPATRAHMRDWLAAISNSAKPVADIEQGHISSAACVLANLSLDLGRSLRWDPENHNVPADEQATALLRRSYRGPWKHPAA